MSHEETSFETFVQCFPNAEQNVLVALYTHIVGKRIIPFKIKDRNFAVYILRTQAFDLGIEFENVLIENGRHPKEVLMMELSGEKLADGRFCLRFLNGFTGEGQQPKESAFSFDSIKPHIKLWDYHIHFEKLESDMGRLPWQLIDNVFCAMDEKRRMLGEAYVNDSERQCLIVYDFIKPYLKCYLDKTTKIGFGKSTVLYDKELFEVPARETSLQAAAVFFESIGFESIARAIDEGHAYSRSFIQNLIYTMQTSRGEKIYTALNEMVKKAAKHYQGLQESLPEMTNFRSYIREELNRLFISAGFRGSYPFYRKAVKPDFVEVSNIYSKQYAYLNEKVKILYFDFLETMTDDDYTIVPLAGIMFPKNFRETEELRNFSGMYCYFLDGGRRNAQIIGDLALSQSMSRKDLDTKLLLLNEVIR